MSSRRETTYPRSLSKPFALYVYMCKHSIKLVYLQIHICTCIHIFIYTHVDICRCIYVHSDVSVYVQICIYIYMPMRRSCCVVSQ